MFSTTNAPRWNPIDPFEGSRERSLRFISHAIGDRRQRSRSLTNQIVDKIDEAYKAKIDLSAAVEAFRDLNNKCILGLISSVETKVDQHY